MKTREHRNAIDRACRRIESSQVPPDLATLAAEAGLSPWHFQRVFKAAVGLSPKRYAMARREQDFSRRLSGARSVTDAIYDAGYAASSAAYRDSRALGMPPAALLAGGANESIRHATASTSLGPILVAATERGICMVEFGAAKVLLQQLHARFPKAALEPADGALDAWVRRVV
jgi:AraC family transcriptional regulator of adaptative response/methylated-DNA-[protein]-cysteine methyltransferase